MPSNILLLAGLPGCVAFRAFDCNSQSSQIEQYSLLDPEPCGNMEKVHAIERELYGEIVQIKKERLVQVTRCTATETVVTQHCGWQSHSGPGRYAKFHDPITIEPAECRQAVKTGLVSPQFHCMYDDLFETTTGTQSRSIPKAQWQYKAGLIDQEENSKGDREDEGGPLVEQQDISRGQYITRSKSVSPTASWLWLITVGITGFSKRKACQARSLARNCCKLWGDTRSSKDATKDIILYQLSVISYRIWVFSYQFTVYWSLKKSTILVVS